MLLAAYLLGSLCTIHCSRAGLYQSARTIATFGKTQPQSFPLLVDTTNSQTWVLGPNAAVSPPTQAKWAGAAPPGNPNPVTYAYLGENVPVNSGYPINVSLPGLPIIPISFGLSTNTAPVSFWGVNQTYPSSGSLSMNRQSPVVTSLASINVQSFSIINNALSFAAFGGGGYLVSKAPTVSATQTLWAVDGSLTLVSPFSQPNFHEFKNNVAILIDAGNPYITIEFKSLGNLTLVKTILSFKPDLNFTVANLSHIILAANYIPGQQIQLTHTPSMSIPGKEMVIRLGQPFLVGRVATMFPGKNEVWIGSPLPPTPPPAPQSQWTTIIIIAAVVVVFGVAFIIGANYYCRLPPESSQRPNEEQPFLGGQAARNGQYSRIVNEPPASSQPAPVQQPSAPVAASSQPSTNASQARGQAVGGSAARDPAAMRNQRLAALERNMQGNDATES